MSDQESGWLHEQMEQWKPDLIVSVHAPYGVSGFVDNLLFLRFVEHRGRVKRLLSITKMRDADYDVGLHAVEITSQGMRIAGVFASDGDVIPSAEPVDRNDQGGTAAARGTGQS